MKEKGSKSVHDFLRAASLLVRLFYSVNQSVALTAKESNQVRRHKTPQKVLAPRRYSSLPPLLPLHSDEILLR